ncbi:metal-dependent hydrolase [Cereibacter sphaeroides]|nr:metal-dependent hydrolase [Cereibacter sphaeroides]
MHFAHMPAGYLLTKLLIGKNERVPHLLMCGALVASVLPDFDLSLYLLGLDDRGAHHGYWTHTPAFWLALLLPVIGVAWLARRPIFAAFFGIVLANTLLHLVLDAVASWIPLLRPFSDAWINLQIDLSGEAEWAVAMQEANGLVELAICAVAALVFLASSSRSRAGSVSSAS